MLRGVVFDLDGTLVDSLPGIAEGVNRALRSLGRPEHPQEAVRGMIGRGSANLCAAAIGYADAALAPTEELEAMHSAFRREYHHCWQGDFTRPYPGIAEMLRQLAAAGLPLAVLSNKPHDVTLPMVRTLFPDIPFHPILGFTGDFPRKPDPAALLHIISGWGLSATEVALVGDSLYDARTAANAGCPLALMGGGYADRAALAAWEAPIFDSATALAEYLLSAAQSL